MYALSTSCLHIRFYIVSTVILIDSIPLQASLNVRYSSTAVASEYLFRTYRLLVFLSAFRNMVHIRITQEPVCSNIYSILVQHNARDSGGLKCQSRINYHIISIVLQPIIFITGLLQSTAVLYYLNRITNIF